MAASPAHHYRRWQWQAPLGLLGVGLGASVVGQATIKKSQRAPTWHWVALGTAGLAALGAGLSLFGDAVKHRALYDAAHTADEPPTGGH
ncbi:hypothetical protein [Salisaeta longa]|uniref:hypothetical protein n=1 Tax=Salisaeta longa TaxID=503170 RepID=UPI0003B6EB37|nr:hypothetical protein [Salisaeta longa]